ncbi:MAG: hypothetical protein ACKVI4_16060 [Actinomycetales bacterium]
MELDGKDAGYPNDYEPDPESERPGYYRLIDPQYVKLQRAAPAGYHWRWDDATLTLIILLMSLQDFGFGIWRMSRPAQFLEIVNNVTLASIDPDTTRLTRVGSFGQVEGGLVGVALVIYRVLRWYKHRHFNGINFQLTFLIGAIGRTGAFITNEQTLGWETFGKTGNAPLDQYFLLTRAGVSVLAFAVSTYTYRADWRWLYK